MELSTVSRLGAHLDCIIHWNIVNVPIGWRCACHALDGSQHLRLADTKRGDVEELIAVVRKRRLASCFRNRKREQPRNSKSDLLKRGRHRWLFTIAEESCSAFFGIDTEEANCKGLWQVSGFTRNSAKSFEIVDGER